MKAILVMEMPSSCRNCHIMFTDNVFANYCPCNRDDVTAYIRNDTKPDWCPLKSAPEKKDENKIYTMTQLYRAQGYNACIDEILGDKE